MNNHRGKHRRWTAVLVVMVLALSLALSGCLDEEADTPGNPEGENWWDHPGTVQQVTEEDADYDWWNLLDDSWTEDDWEYAEDGVWMIFDEETQSTYLYDEDSQEFAAMDMETEEMYMLDMDSGEWVPAD